MNDAVYAVPVLTEVLKEIINLIVTGDIAGEYEFGVPAGCEFFYALF